MLDENEKNQLEQWTNKKCGDVIFDSDKDDWSVNTSVFDDSEVFFLLYSYFYIIIDNFCKLY